MYPKIVWSFWHSEPPESVASIIESNKNVLTNWDVRFLKHTNVLIPLPKNLAIQHQSDYLRLLLLSMYGGCWMDASIRVNDQSKIDEMYYRMISENADMVGFSLGQPQLSYVENWFIMAPKGSPLIKEWLDEYKKAVEMGFQRYKNHLFKEGVSISERIYRQNDSNVYLTQHACLQKVLQKSNEKFKIILYNSEDSMFKIHVQCDWDVNCIKEKLPQATHLPFVKFRGVDR
jgi:hypothetical protein